MNVNGDIQYDTVLGCISNSNGETAEMYAISVARVKLDSVAPTDKLGESIYQQCCQHHGIGLLLTREEEKKFAPQFGKISATHIRMGFDLAPRFGEVFVGNTIYQYHLSHMGLNNKYVSLIARHMLVRSSLAPQASISTTGHQT